MTAFAHDPMFALMLQQTESVLRSTRGLDDDDLRAPSRLPGWSRGHVLAHLARNADGFANLARTAVTGIEQPMYPSREARDGEIEQGSGRALAEHLVDLQESATRLNALLAQVPAGAVNQQVPTGMGAQFRVGDLPWMRLRELAYHHVDLGCGVTFADLPAQVLRAGLAECEGRLTKALPAGSSGFTARARFTGPDELVVRIGAGSSTSASGAAADVLAWLTGRSAGTGVVSDDGSPLPDVPAWG